MRFSSAAIIRNLARAIGFPAPLRTLASVYVHCRTCVCSGPTLVLRPVCSVPLAHNRTSQTRRSPVQQHSFIHSFIHSSMTLQPIVGPWSLLSVAILYTGGRTPWMRINPSPSRSLHLGQHRINTDIYPLLEWVWNPGPQCWSGRARSRGPGRTRQTVLLTRDGVVAAVSVDVGSLGLRRVLHKGTLVSRRRPACRWKHVWTRTAVARQRKDRQYQHWSCELLLLLLLLVPLQLKPVQFKV
jgi:hypothetical protein